MVSLTKFETSNELARGVAKCIIHAQNEALTRSSHFLIAISGGTLIKILKTGLLNDPELSSQVHWEKWHIYFCDERLVPLDHDDSNYGCFKKLILNPLLQDSTHLGPTIFTINESLVRQNSADNNAIADEYESLLPDSFDLILLGCGPDGHTCSLFPGKAHEYLVKETERRVLWCYASPKPPSDRITFTLPVLKQSKKLCFVTEGTAKKDALHKIFQEKDISIPCALINQLFSDKVAWYLTKDAME